MFLCLIAIALLLLAVAATLSLIWRDLKPPFSAHAAAGKSIPLAVLGDSNSHHYQDRILLTKAEQRGGEWRTKTHQWTEVLASLRAEQLDQGELGVWGTPIKVAETLDWLRNKAGIGYGGRAPKKRDFRFNFTVSGAECDDLGTGYYRQTSRLLALMARNPERWQNGIVLIHIGVNSIGQPPVLEQYARQDLTPALKARLESCVQSVTNSAAQIRAAHPGTRLVLVGMLTGIHEPGAIQRWTSRAEVDRINSAVEVFNRGLREFAAADGRAMYFDQDAWIQQLWGGRDTQGRPDYRPVVLADGRKITLT
ncbi:MAG: SGNH/GDSL hydrolase family protein, partial [Betaproteobacteria bacterium]|nr:SGNH/GDSL hydrolase family protein [Betaproteobacteria bacterium]